MSDIQEEQKRLYKRAEENDNRLNKDTVAVLVKPKKYIEMLEQANNMYSVYPPKKVNKKNGYVTEVRTMYNLPVIISQDIDEDMKFVNKEELEQIQILEQKRYE